MRVISGSARGRKLLTPKNDRIRPTADRVKESLFNILAVQTGNLAGLKVLDVFAGTGNLGIEALSRGAAEAVFIDENREAASLVKKNLELTGLDGKGRVLQKEALAALKMLGTGTTPFGLVFLDPPYRKGLAGQVMEFLAGSALIDENTVVVAETAAREDLPEAFGRLRQFDRRVYGDTAIAFYMRENSEM
ncbi:MAG TPA: 16S rRNA (guanine(966)-N(2))-methyltransferase RsmD [Geobacteraceae bacterium]